jgi:predicted Zn-dependent peptidase
MYRLFVVSIFLWSLSYAQKHPNELTNPGEIKFKPEQPIEFTLSNGVTVFFLENRELPLINLGALIKAGSLHEPKNGLCAVMGVALRTGGTKSITGDAIDEKLEFLSASIECGIGSEYANVTSECLKKDFKTVLNLFADVIINPEFRQDKIDLAKNQLKERIKRRFDQPDRVASELFSEKVYGANTPFGSRIKVNDINKITREDMFGYHKSYFVPKSTFLSISGDISVSELKPMLEEAFKGWENRDVKIPDLPPLVENADGTIYYINKDVPQANIAIGHLGIERNNPDQYTIELLNNIFGGGFTSRLNKELRSNRGLTYGIRGGVNGGKVRGVFLVSSQIKAANCIEALSVIKETIRELQTNLVSDEEINQAKNSITNSFVFRFEQKDRYLASFVNMKLNEYPADYYDKYISNIQKVTKEEIREAANKYMNPGKMIMVIVGNQDKFEKPLSSIGKVNIIDLNKLIEEETKE